MRARDYSDRLGYKQKSVKKYVTIWITKEFKPISVENSSKLIAFAPFA